MNFAAPWALWLLLVPVLLALILLLRPPALRRQVTTLAFFDARLRRRGRLQRFRAVPLPILVALLAVLALAGPRGEMPVLTPLVVVIDRSASMAAVDASGQSRLQQGLAQLENLLLAEPRSRPVTLLTTDTPPVPLLRASLDRQQLAGYLAELHPRPVPDAPQAALDLARQLAGDDGAVWICSDQAPAARVERQILIGARGANAGIIAAACRRLPLRPDQAEVLLRLQTSEAMPARLSLYQNDELLALRELQLDTSAQELLLPIELTGNHLLRLHLQAAGDVLAFDDQLLLPLPEPVRLRLLLLCPELDGFTQLALATLAETAELQTLNPEQWATASASTEVDAVIAVGCWPEPWPAAPVIVLAPPPRAELGIESIPAQLIAPPRSFDPEHPLLYGVSPAELALAQTARLQGAAWETVLTGAVGPLLARRSVAGQAVTVLAADPRLSPRLLLTASFPSLLAAALFESLQDSFTSAQLLPTGERLSVSGPVSWRLADPASETAESANLVDGLLWLDRIGVWQQADGRQGGAGLLNASETLQAASPAPAQAERPPRRWWPSLASLCLIAALALSLVDGWRLLGRSDAAGTAA